MINVFFKNEIAEFYDDYYQSEKGKAADAVERNLFLSLLKHVPRTEILEQACESGY